MRCIMMGTGPFAVPAFHSVVAAHDVPLLVTRPWRANPSRQKQSGNRMQRAAEALGIAVIAPDDVNAPGVSEQLAKLSPDVLVVCDFGQLLSRVTLALASLGGINLHASLLPKYRGAAPINWAIARGEKETGITVLHMTPRLDAGPNLVQRRTPIGEDETAVDLEQRLSQLGAEAVLDSLRLLSTWDRQSPIGEPQDHRQATRAPRLRKEDGQVNWRRSATEIRNQLRALEPWPGTYTYLHAGKPQLSRLILKRVSVVPGNVTAAPGSVVACDASNLTVACGQDALALEKVQPAGKRLMPIEEFLRGHRLRVGDQFVSAADPDS